jgi:hypothetical protein
VRLLHRVDLCTRRRPRSIRPLSSSKQDLCPWTAPRRFDEHPFSRSARFL